MLSLPLNLIVSRGPRWPEKQGGDLASLHVRDKPAPDLWRNRIHGERRPEAHREMMQHRRMIAAQTQPESPTTGTFGQNIVMQFLLDEGEISTICESS